MATALDDVEISLFCSYVGLGLEFGLGGGPKSSIHVYAASTACGIRPSTPFNFASWLVGI